MTFNPDSILPILTSQPWMDTNVIAREPIVFLGVMCGVVSRGERLASLYALQRTFAAAKRIRTIFIVSADFPTSTIIAEKQLFRTAEIDKLPSKYNTLRERVSTWRKLAEFMRLAAVAPEPFVARADDDAAQQHHA